MTRRQRMTLELLGPPLLGAALVTLQMFWESVRASTGATGLLETLKTAPIMIFAFVWLVGAAILCVGVQTLCYAAVMEWRFARGLDPRSWRAVGLSTLLGFASGAVLVVGYGIRRGDAWFFAGFGLIVGLLLGLAIRWLSKPGGPR